MLQIDEVVVEALRFALGQIDPAREAWRRVVGEAKGLWKLIEIFDQFASDDTYVNSEARNEIRGQPIRTFDQGEHQVLRLDVTVVLFVGDLLGD